jgi:predicted dehydrogenase
MTKLKVGIIGLGMGRHHARQFAKHPNCDVVALADLNTDLLKQLGDELKVEKRYTNAEEMLQNETLDIACIATPNTFHKPLTLAAFEAGAHVLCEKPMAMNAKEAREMLAASKAANKRLMINFSFRFTPQSSQIKKEVESGILGDIYYARTEWLRRRGLPGFGGWFGQKALSGGGPLIDLGVHRLDLALWLMGHPKPTWVMASTCNAIASKLAEKNGYAFDVEDFATAMIKFENGATIDLAASWASNIKENELIQTRLLGTDGGLIQRNCNEGYAFEAEVYVERNGSQFDMKPHGNAPDATSPMAHFADCIINDVPHTATGEEGLLVMEILDAIYASAEKGEPVKIED